MPLIPKNATIHALVVSPPQVGEGNVLTASVCLLVSKITQEKLWVDFHQIRRMGRLRTR